MASQSKTKTVKFEVDQLVEFNNRVGRVSRIAKNGSVYVTVLGETTVADQTREELRVKKADLQLVNDVLEHTGDAVSVEDYVRHVIRNNISCDVSSNAKLADNGAYELAPEYIPSPGCLEYCKWEGSADAARVLELVGLDLVKLANLYVGKKTQSMQTVPAGWDKIEADAQQEIEEIVPQQASVDSKPAAALSLESALALADATYALRELTFSVTRHSILTAFIDVALNKDIPGYHYQVAGNIKNLMAASFDPVHDSMGYARINTWTMAALELLVKNKERVRKMLSQPIEAAPIKIDRVTKLGMWLDKNMQREGLKVDDLTAAYDSCYMYDAIGKKLKACSFVVVEVAQAMDSNAVQIQPQWQECLTAQSAIAIRKQYLDSYRPTGPDGHLYCGIVPVYKTGGSMRAAVEDVLASVIGSLK